MNKNIVNDWMNENQCIVTYNKRRFGADSMRNLWSDVNIVCSAVENSFFPNLRSGCSSKLLDSFWSGGLKGNRIKKQTQIFHYIGDYPSAVHDDGNLKC